MLGQPLRAGHIRQALIKNRLHQRHATLDHIANHVKVGLQLGLFGVKAADQRNAHGLQLGAHRRVNIAVTAGDGVAGCLGQGGNAAHEGAANAKNVNMHDGSESGKQSGGKHTAKGGAVLGL